MQSKATTVEQYLAELPADRREAIQSLREVFRKNIDSRVEEGMQYGMIGYYVPHRIFPAGYHCDPRQPLPYAGLASQKNHLSMYIMMVYGGGELEKWLRDAWTKTGRKLDMGKCCIRFKRIEDVPLDVVGEAIRRVPLDGFIKFYEEAIRGQARKSSAAKPTATKKKVSAKKKPAAAKKTVKKVTKGPKAVKKKAKKK